jgi:hypothetical protein
MIDVAIQCYSNPKDHSTATLYRLEIREVFYGAFRGVPSVGCLTSRSPRVRGGDEVVTLAIGVCSQYTEL